jgi:light-regulated signal transduction histidine kinase (bacteriophytochrome)
VRIQGQAFMIKGKIIKYFAIEEDVLLKRARIKREFVIRFSKTNKNLDYAQIVSHDLKSPLRSINSLITGLKRENVDL